MRPSAAAARARRRLRAVVTACAAMVVVPGSGAAQAGAGAAPLEQWAIRAWDEREGLPTVGVRAVAQTSDGFVWLGTEMGLVRFDGHRFRHGDIPGYEEFGNPVWYLHEDAAGTLWIPVQGRGVVRYREGRIEEVPGSGVLGGATVNEIVGDGAGGAWLGVEGFGLLHLTDGGARRFGTESGIPAGGVVSLASAAAGGLWLGTRGGGVLRFGEGGVRTVPGLRALAEEEVLSIHEDLEGTLWIGARSGLFRWSGERLERLGAERGAPTGTVHAMAEGPEPGVVWFASDQGLYWHRSGVFASLGEEDGLPGSDIRTLHVHPDGRVWVGTQIAGLALVRAGEVVPLGVEQGLPAPVVLPVLEDRRGAVWMGTYGGGLARYADGRIRTLGVEEGLTDPVVLALTQDSAGVVWAGTRRGIFHVSGDGNQARQVFPDPGEGPMAVLVLHTDARGRVWAGGPTGVVRYEARPGGGWVAVRGGLPREHVYAVGETRDGAVWFGTNGQGLFRVDDGGVTRLTTEDGLPANTVLSIFEDREGDLWIGSTGGLTRRHDGAFSTLSRRHGLPDNVVLKVMDDAGGDLWLSTNRGLVRVRPQAARDVLEGRQATLEFLLLGEAHGMPSREANGGMHPAGWRTRDGRLWFPTVAGMAIVDPRVVDRAEERKPAVVVEGVTADDRSVALPGAPEVEIPAGAHRVTFDFTAPDFLFPNDLLFRIRLGGHRNEWENLGHGRSAAFTSLPPGRYTLEVQARYPGTPWGEAARVPVRVRPLFFQAAWFKLLVGLMVVGGAAGGVWAGMSAAERRRRRLEEANRALEERVEERTHALSAANAELARANADLEAFSRSVSHDLRSPLRTIGGFAALLEEERGSELGEEGTRYLRTIQDRARHMAGLIEDMLRFSRAARNALEWERLDMEALVREVWTDLQEDHPEWTPAVEIGALPGARGDRALVRQVWTNLLSNAAKFSSRAASPALHVGGCRQDGLSRFQVRDNGVGFDMAHRDRLFHHSVRLHAAADFPGNGVGLSMVKRIVEAHGGEVGAESAPGAGAAFWFALPGDDAG